MTDERARILLKASRKMLDQADSGLDMRAFYDGVVCDHVCLISDIDSWLEDNSSPRPAPDPDTEMEHAEEISSVMNIMTDFRVQKHLRASTEHGKTLYAVFSGAKQMSPPKSHRDAQEDLRRITAATIVNALID